MSSQREKADRCAGCTRRPNRWYWSMLGRRQRAGRRCRAGCRHRIGQLVDRRRARLARRRGAVARGDARSGPGHRPGLELPVTADLERGYGDARLTSRERWRRRGRLQPRGLRRRGGLSRRGACSVVAAARAAGDAAGIPLVINARTDVYLGTNPAQERLVAAVERGAAYMEAGADCIFVPGVPTSRRSRRWCARWTARSASSTAPAGRRWPSWPASGSRASARPRPARRGDGRAGPRRRDAARRRRPAGRAELPGLAGGDDQRARRGAAGAAQAVRGPAVEASVSPSASVWICRRGDLERAAGTKTATSPVWTSYSWASGARVPPIRAGPGRRARRVGRGRPARPAGRVRRITWTASPWRGWLQAPTETSAPRRSGRPRRRSGGEAAFDLAQEWVRQPGQAAELSA